MENAFPRKIDFMSHFFAVWFKINYFLQQKKYKLNNFNDEKYPTNDHVKNKY